jgi:ATP-dependent RNA circularization protein (DNA/RNA ligase family)
MGEEKKGLKTTFKEIRKEAKEIGKEVGGVILSPVKDGIDQIGEKIVDEIENTIKSAAERLKELEKITGVGIAEIEIKFEAEGKLGNIFSTLTSDKVKGGITIKLQRLDK